MMPGTTRGMVNYDDVSTCVEDCEMDKVDGR